jgi:hypothetical protein
MSAKSQALTLLSAALDQWVTEGKTRRALGEDIGYELLFREAHENLGIDPTQDLIPYDRVGPAMMLVALILERLLDIPSPEVGGIGGTGAPRVVRDD